MTSRRRGPQIWVALWLVCQMSTLMALVPRDCCAAHRPEQGDPHAGHGPVAPAAPAASADEHAHHQMHQEDVPPVRQCAVRGTCDGPMAALMAVLSIQVVPPSEAFHVLPDLRVVAAIRSADQVLTSLLAPPDAPPPRA
jgi:hypothetical protein